MNNCQSNCPSYFGEKTSDGKVVYTGPSISALGICQGDSLSTVEAAILQAIINYSTGVGINIPGINLTQCALFSSYITCCTGCTDLACLMNVVFGSLCTLYTDFTTLQSEVSALLATPSDLACLQNLGSNPTLLQILQEIILELCTAESNIAALQNQFSNLSTTLGNTIGNFLLTAIQSCSTGNIIKAGTGSTATITFNGFSPIGTLTPYVGPMTFNSGVGYSNTCGWNIANGLNGTINMMGQSPIGLTNMGGVLPSNATGITPITTVGQLVGEPNHTLVVAEIPADTISGTLPAHNHPITGMHMFKSTTGTSNLVTVLDINTPPDDDAIPAGSWGPTQTFTSIIGNSPAVSFSGSGAGKGLGHNNIQPSTGVVWIQRMF